MRTSEHQGLRSSRPTPGAKIHGSLKSSLRDVQGLSPFINNFGMHR